MEKCKDVLMFLCGLVVGIVLDRMVVFAPPADYFTLGQAVELARCLDHVPSDTTAFAHWLVEEKTQRLGRCIGQVKPQK